MKTEMNIIGYDDDKYDMIALVYIKGIKGISAYMNSNSYYPILKDKYKNRLITLSNDLNVSTPYAICGSLGEFSKTMSMLFEIEIIKNVFYKDGYVTFNGSEYAVELL